MSRAPHCRVIPRQLRLGLMAFAAAATIFTLPGGAADLSKGSYTLKLDTALSWGTRYRLEDPDPAIIGLANGGTAFSVNGDDGNLNFGTGLVSNALRATVDLDYSYKNFGAFVRGTGFYDYQIEESGTDRTPLHPDAMDWVGSRAELLDAFVFYKFRVGSGGGQVRAGQQVLNWGESTFTQGGLNSINPVDVATLRVPGSELREAYRPSGLVWGSLDFTDKISTEVFYQYEWEETIPDPSGTYFSGSDFSGLGNQYVFLGFGSASDVDESVLRVADSGPSVPRAFLTGRTASRATTASTASLSAFCPKRSAAWSSASITSITTAGCRS